MRLFDLAKISNYLQMGNTLEVIPEANSVFQLTLSFVSDSVCFNVSELTTIR